jgi:hypothetical protein
MKWSVEFEDGVWLESNQTTLALNRAGYAAGAFKDDKTGVHTYTLHRVSDDLNGPAYPIIFETEDLDQLNAYINLILPKD